MSEKQQQLGNSRRLFRGRDPQVGSESSMYVILAQDSQGGGGKQPRQSWGIRVPWTGREEAGMTAQLTPAGG